MSDPINSARVPESHSKPYATINAGGLISGKNYTRLTRDALTAQDKVNIDAGENDHSIRCPSHYFIYYRTTCGRNWLTNFLSTAGNNAMVRIFRQIWVCTKKEFFSGLFIYWA